MFICAGVSTCMCVRAGVYGCELTISMYIHVYVDMLSVCVCVTIYFRQEVLILPCEYKWRWPDKSRATT